MQNRERVGLIIMGMDTFNEIIKEPENGNFIYRGEPEVYLHVSSGLLRKYSYEWDIESYQESELEYIKRYIGGSDDRKILTKLQHYGGKTNLIDFTTDYRVALFFATRGSYHKDGRIILLDRSSEEVASKIYEPSPEEDNRVQKQKSVFFRSERGYIDDSQYTTQCVPSNLKVQIRNYLKTEHDISHGTIFNDIPGFIKDQEARMDAIQIYDKGIEHYQNDKFCDAIKCFTDSINTYPDSLYAYGKRDPYMARGLAYKQLGKYESAIKDYNIAAQLNAVVIVYYNRGCAYNANEEYACAIKDFDLVLRLAPDKDKEVKRLAYESRGWAWLHLCGWEQAKDDIQIAKDMGIDLSRIFHNFYNNVKDFEEKNDVKVPGYIADILGE